MLCSIRDLKLNISIVLVLSLSVNLYFCFLLFFIFLFFCLSHHNSHDSSLWSCGIRPMRDTLSFVPAMWSSVVKVIKDASLAVACWLLWSLGLQSSRQAFNNGSNIRYVSQIEAKDNSKQEQKGVINVRSVQEPKGGVCNHSYFLYLELNRSLLRKSSAQKGFNLNKLMLINLFRPTHCDRLIVIFWFDQERKPMPTLFV